ncbi:MAG: hypothetical protein QM737_00425 [Ferruginibacter sp.]
MMEDSNAAAVSNQEENVLNKNENEVVNSSNDDNMIMTSRAIPAPADKYARPADPFHGNKSTVKRRSNIAPSGKKPLWNR